MIFEIKNKYNALHVIRVVDETSDLSKLSFPNFTTVLDFIDENDINLNIMNCNEQFKWVNLDDLIEELSESDLDLLYEFLDDSERKEYGSDKRQAVLKYCKANGIVELTDVLSYKYDVVLYDDVDYRLFIYRN